MSAFQGPPGQQSNGAVYRNRYAFAKTDQVKSRNSYVLKRSKLGYDSVHISYIADIIDVKLQYCPVDGKNMQDAQMIALHFYIPDVNICSWYP